MTSRHPDDVDMFAVTGKEPDEDEDSGRQRRRPTQAAEDGENKELMTMSQKMRTIR
jgi:hypothetical protein